MYKFLVRCRARLWFIEVCGMAYWYLYIIPFMCHKSVLQIDLSKLDNEILRLTTFMYLNNMISRTKYIDFCKEIDELKSLKVDL